MKKIRILGLLVLAVMLAVVLVACIPTNANTAANNLEKKSYSVYTATDGSIFNSMSGKYSGLNTYVYGVCDTDYVKIWYFNSAKEANAAYDAIKNDYIGYTTSSDTKSGKNGKYIYVGTKKGVKAAQ